MRRQHITDGGTCWCEPSVEFRQSGHIVIHNSTCPECKEVNGHTWWCTISPEELQDGTKPYYWKD